MIGYLALEDGTIYTGKFFGHAGEQEGEVVFNTSLCGYQEILTDPSYNGQIVVMTNPHIGNYGINDEDFESRIAGTTGFVIKEKSRITSNWRSSQCLESYLEEHKIIGIEGIDTRDLTKRIRNKGSLKGIISTINQSKTDLIKKAKNSTSIIYKNLVTEVTSNKTWSWNDQFPIADSYTSKHIIAYDFGIKYSILRQLQNHNCKITVVPSNSSFELVESLNPDGILLSNGPGNPAKLQSIIKEIQKLIGTYPIFAICLGHQLLAHALGGSTYKLKFGHHGGNHPVYNHLTKKVEITSQNHGFCVDENTLNQQDIEILYTNLNDNTHEGFRHKNLPILSIQFHPEAAPGPHDSQDIFKEFVTMMGNTHAKTS